MNKCGVNVLVALLVPLRINTLGLGVSVVESEQLSLATAVKWVGKRRHPVHRLTQACYMLVPSPKWSQTILGQASKTDPDICARCISKVSEESRASESLISWYTSRLMAANVFWSWSIIFIDLYEAYKWKWLGFVVKERMGGVYCMRIIQMFICWGAACWADFKTWLQTFVVFVVLCGRSIHLLHYKCHMLHACHM